MQHQPRQPGEVPGKLQLADLRDGAVAGDRRHAALVEVMERLAIGWVVIALDHVFDHRGGVSGPLDRALSHPGYAGHEHQIADYEDVRMSLDGEIGFHDHPSGPVDFGSVGSLGDHLAQRAGRHAGRPNLARAFDAAFAAVLFLDGDAFVVDRGHHRVELNLDVHLFQPPLCLETQLWTHRRQHRGCGVEQDHPALTGRDGPKRACQGALGELDDLPSHLDAGRPSADDDERQAPLPFGMVGADLGGLERAQDAAAQLQRVVDGLHSGREGGEFVVAEVGLLCAGGHDEAVVRRHRGHVHQFRRDRLRFQVDRVDLAQQHPDVLLPAQDQPGGRGNVALGQDPGGHLIQQRLEQVGRCLGDQRDVDIRPFKRLGRIQAAESTTDDDHAMAPADGRGFTR